MRIKKGKLVIPLAFLGALLPLCVVAAEQIPPVACSDSQSISTAYGSYQVFNDYRGVVSRKAVGMTLVFHGTEVVGEVFVAPDFRNITVKGAVKLNGELILKASRYKKLDDNVFRGKFKEAVNCESLHGSWDHSVSDIPADGWLLNLDHTNSADEGKNYYSMLGVHDDRQIDDNALALQRAIIAKHKEVVSEMVHYPLSVIFGRHRVKIKDRAQFLGVYDRIFIPAMVSEIAAAIPHHMFSKDIGALLTSNIWLDDSGKLYSIDVVGGPKENPNIYEIDYVCDTARYHIVIDSKADEIPRYRAWIKRRTMTMIPDMEIDNGSETFEGTGVCAHSIWTFKKGDARFDVSELGCTDGSEPKGASGELDITIRGKLRQTLWCMETKDSVN